MQKVGRLLDERCTTLHPKLSHHVVERRTGLRQQRTVGGFFPQLVDRGCRLWLTPGPFNHSKLCVIDDAWVIMGSANLDAHSLRLNFEFCLECYDATLAKRLSQHIDEPRAQSFQVDLSMLNTRSLPMPLRDGVARLAPYL